MSSKLLTPDHCEYCGGSDFVEKIEEIMNKYKGRYYFSRSVPVLARWRAQPALPGCRFNVGQAAPADGEGMANLEITNNPYLGVFCL
jgi:hypothetical protein